MARRGTTVGGKKRSDSSDVHKKAKEEHVSFWEQKFRELSAFQQQHGHCNVPSATKLGSWVRKQKLLRRRGELAGRRYGRLKQLGFEWNKRKDWGDDRWSVMYDKLKAYKQKYGDCLVPRQFKDDMKLGRWVSKQRFHRNEMSKKREKLLDEIGFVWNAEGYKARSAAGARKRLKKSRPETLELFSVGTLVLKYFDGDGWFLGEIASNTAGYRVVYEDGDREFYTLDSEQLMEMVDDARDVTADEILLDPDADEDDDTETEENCDDSELEDVEAEQVEDGLFSNEALEEEKKEAEDELFGTHDVEDEAENAEDELLSESDLDEEETDTKEEVEHPRPAPKQSSFEQATTSRGTSVGVSKTVDRNGVRRKRREEHVRLWELRFRELSAFKRQHGHCNIPTSNKLATWVRKLATWVRKQKRLHRQGKLPLERYARLKKLGLEWDDRRKTSRDDAWSVMYDKLKAYKRKYGDCMVPRHFKDDMKLGRWVSKQPSRRNEMSKKREKLLDEIGFVWNRREARSAAGARKSLKRSRPET